MTHWKAALEEMNQCIASPTEENWFRLKRYLLDEKAGANENHILPDYAARLFLFLGPGGIRILRETIRQASGTRLPSAIFETIYEAAHKKVREIPVADEVLPLLVTPVIDDETERAAVEILHELVSESLTDRRLFAVLVQFASQQEAARHGGKGPSLTTFMFQAFREHSIKINKKVLEDYQEIIQNPDSSEKDCTQYLLKHPALIDPLAKEIILEDRRGAAYNPDLVIRTYKDEYVFVAIEQPGTSIFTKSDDFTAKFSHALGQVLDFQEWAETNKAYADQPMPSINVPSGLLILGMSSALTERQKKKLRRFNINSQGKVKVMTFDEVLENSWRVYNNIIR